MSFIKSVDPTYEPDEAGRIGVDPGQPVTVYSTDDTAEATEEIAEEDEGKGAEPVTEAPKAPATPSK